MFSRFKVHHHFLRILSLLGVWFLIGHWDVLQNLLDIRLETHVNHTIGFIEDHVGAAAQDQVAVFQHVDQTAGGCDNNLLDVGNKQLVNMRYVKTELIQCECEDRKGFQLQEFHAISCMKGKPIS